MSSCVCDVVAASSRVIIHKEKFSICYEKLNVFCVVRASPGLTFMEFPKEELFELVHGSRCHDSTEVEAQTSSPHTDPKQEEYAWKMPTRGPGGGGHGPVSWSEVSYRNKRLPGPGSAAQQ